MKLSTPVAIEAASSFWTHAHRFIALGSCFADQVASRLAENLFSVLANPLGVGFNPISLARSVERALSGDAYRDEEFFLQLGLWRHFDLHSELARTDRDRAVEQANAASQRLRSAIADADCLLLTLGTAWVYRHRPSGLDVGHNHRLEASPFDKHLLDARAIGDALGQALSAARKVNPKLRVVLTVSPVRHLRDGLRENNLSKATLLLAARSIEQTHPGAEYFPAYEILLDELRDYRFYADDLAHPSPLAIRYIWDRLAEAYLEPDTKTRCAEIESIRTALAHRPRHPDTESHSAFIARQAERINALAASGIDIEPLRALLPR